MLNLCVDGEADQQQSYRVVVRSFSRPSCRLHMSWHPMLATTSLDRCQISFCWLQPRLLHMNAVTDAVQNVTFMHMPPERRAVFDVPIEVCTGRHDHLINSRWLVVDSGIVSSICNGCDCYWRCSASRYLSLYASDNRRGRVARHEAGRLGQRCAAHCFSVLSWRRRATKHRGV